MGERCDRTRCALLASGHRDLYLSRDRYDGLESSVALVVNPPGPIRLRVVDDDAWELIPRADWAPRAAVALDLLDSADPRNWIAAEALVAPTTSAVRRSRTVSSNRPDHLGQERTHSSSKPGRGVGL